MYWKNTETPTFEGSSGTKPAVVERLEAIDESGNVCAAVIKAVDGSLSFEVDGSDVLASDTRAYEIKSADFTAVADHRYQVDTSGGVVTATLPASATAGDEIVFEDAALAWATHNLTLGRNSLKINSGTSDYTADVVGGRLSCVYISSAIGWSVK